MNFTGVERYQGTVRVAAQQSDVQRKIQADLSVSDPTVKHGLCAGYSATWVTKSAQGKSFWQWIDSGSARGDLLHMAHTEQKGMDFIAYNMDKSGGQIQRGPEFDAAVKKARDYKETWASRYVSRETQMPAERTKGTYDVGAIAEGIIGTNGFKLFTATGTTKGGHAMAAFVNDDGVTFMDPNAGEVHFDDKYGFAMWLMTDHMKQYDFAKFTEYSVDTFATDTNPAEFNDQVLAPAQANPASSSPAVAAAAAAASATTSTTGTTATSASAPPGGRGPVTRGRLAMGGHRGATAPSSSEEGTASAVGGGTTE